MVVRVDVPAEMYAWALQRAGLDRETLTDRFPKLDAWESGERQPTLNQLEAFANRTHTPIGYFFLAEPPQEEVPIPDFRTIGDKPITRPSPNLLDTIYQCQQRQDWYRSHALANRLDALPLVGSLSTTTSVTDAASSMTHALAFAVERRGASWSNALTYLRDRAEGLGVLVMVNGVVGSNTHRKLNPGEFRGFALADALAPLVFVNGADTKSAQLFTLAHELAHVWLGESALSDADLAARTSHSVELWCNRVAAEVLVPQEALRAEFRPDGNLTQELDRLARRFKSSTLVVLRRIHESGHLGWSEYRRAYSAELRRVMEIQRARESSDDGGNFYKTQQVRVGKLFARSVIASTLEGHTLYSDAFRMLGFKKSATFDEFARRLGVV